MSPPAHRFAMKRVPLGRWILVILLGQLALVCLLGNWSSTEAHVSAVRVIPRLVWLPGMAPDSALLPGGAVLAEVSCDGFSGALWRGGDAMRLSSPLAPGFQEGTRLGTGSGPTFVASGIEQAVWPAESSGAQGFAEFPSGAMPALASRTVRLGMSRLRLGGALASLSVEAPGVLPVWTNNDVLAPSRLQLLVEPGAGVLSAVLLPGGSGLAGADQEALRLARQLRFPVPAARGTGLESARLLWGTADLVWHTVEPPASP